MKFYENVCKSKQVLSLQQFAENPEGSEGGEDKGTNTDPVVPTFENYAEFQSYLDAEKDKHSNKAIQTAKQKWELSTKEKVDSAKSEAERLATLTAEERAEAKENERIEKLNERESNLNKRELKAVAVDILSDKGIDIGMADVLTYTDETTTKAHLDAVSKAFDIAVEAGINKRLADSAYVPPTGSKTTAKTQAETIADEMNQQQQTKTGFWD